jgi:aspartate racemase
MIKDFLPDRKISAKLRSGALPYLDTLFGNRSKGTYNQKAMGLKNKQSSTRIIGILGGMGPEATLDLFRCIIHLTPASKDQDHFRILIYSNPKIPDRTKAIAAGGESPVPQLIESAKVLENGGAGIIAMPCNAAHYFLPEVRHKVGIPFLDMIEETVSKLHAQLPNARTVGLIASNGTACSGVYPRSLSSIGVEVLTPSEIDQQRIGNAIDQVKAGTHNQSTRETFQQIGLKLAQSGAEAVILGCTEIPLAFDAGAVPYVSLNPTKILAEAAVDWALGKRDKQ